MKGFRLFPDSKYWKRGGGGWVSKWKKNNERQKKGDADSYNKDYLII